MPAPDLLQQVFAPLLQTVPSSDTARDFLVLSANGRPRWLLPARQRKLDPFLASWCPYRLDSRLKWHAVRAANRCGCLSLLPGITTSRVAGLGSVDWKSVGWNSEVPPVIAVYLGTPGPACKAVIHLLDAASGVCQIIVKAPINEDARAAILQEADVLIALAAERRTFAPRLLSVDRVRGISAQTVLPGAAGSRRLVPEYLQLLRSLRLPAETTSIAEHIAPLREHLLCSAASDRDLATVTAALSQMCDARPLPAFWVHGDFAPWNIKHQSDGPAALLDWEDAHRGGLPLQDAFHFLHIQDYLFGKRPTAHAQDLNGFARELGLDTTQCRQLEIAYLVQSYRQRLSQQQPSHSDFLLDTLRVALREGQRAGGKLSLVQNQLAQPESAPSLAALQIRSDLFSAVIAEFNRAQLQYCVLSGYQDYPDRTGSDVDLMVSSADMRRVGNLLAHAAEGCGARVVQAIQHEISACYFVLAKEDGRAVGLLNPDCCSDYRRRGRLWLRANAILAARQPFREFYVPAVPDEFIYYLIKKVLKQSIDAGQMQRLRNLYQRAPQECGDRLRGFWSPGTADALIRALAEQDLGWVAANRTSLLSELEASGAVEGPCARLASRLCGLQVALWRILRPTGMCVVALGGKDGPQACDLATALQQALAPAFRWTDALQVASQQTRGSSKPAQHLRILDLLRLAFKTRLARIRSTLAICVVDHRQLAASKRLASMFIRLMFRPDMLVVLGSNPRNNSEGPVSYLDENWPLQDIAQHASSVILQWLATRQSRRMRINEECPALEKSLPEDHVELPDLQYREAK